MATLTSCQTLRLLMWKNTKSAKNKMKKPIFFEILLPSSMCLLLLIINAKNPPETMEPVSYEPVRIDKLEAYEGSKLLLYTPKNHELKKIVESAAASLGLTSELVGCISQMESRFKSSPFFAGIVFDESLRNIRDLKTVRKFGFSLRFPTYLRSGKKMHLSDTWSTNILFDTDVIGKPRNAHDTDGGLPPAYIREGFLALQNALTKAYLKTAGGAAALPDIQMQRFPYSKYQTTKVAAEILPSFVTLSFLAPTSVIVEMYVREKQLKHKYLLKMLGVHYWQQCLAWLVRHFIVGTITALLVSSVLKMPLAKTGAVIENTPFTVILTIALFYVADMICFCFFMSVFFSDSKMAAILSCMFLFFLQLLYDVLAVSSSQILKIGGCLIPPIAMNFGLELISSYDSFESGLEWSYLFTPLNLDEKMSLGLILIMMLGSCLLYLLVSFYLEQIFPEEDDVPIKWYFPFSKRFWNRSYKLIQLPSNIDFNSFEATTGNKEAGLQFVNLRKEFGSHVAVNNVSLTLYEDEITVLLGHSGSGKTTLVSMLTGSLKPTSGTAVINGYDMLRQPKSARRSLGICPQHNSTFEDLTVLENLIFFGRLKGLKYKDARREAILFLHFLHLETNYNDLCAILSDVSQQKLCLCSAFCGGAKVIFCDEPTAGLEPYARRQLWKFMQSHKNGRTILFTTDNMDEADILGDRIAIMCHGEIKCYGSSFFLKKKYGSGYHLICVKEPGCNPEEVTKLMQNHIPEINPESEIGTELTYTIGEDYYAKLEQICRDLDSELRILKISGYRISICTMDEVFMKAGEEIDEGLKEEVKTGLVMMDTSEIKLLKGWRLDYNQWKALFLKKYLFLKRSWPLLLILFTIPILCILTTMTDLSTSLSTLPKMDISLSQYPNAIVVVEESDNPLIESYKAIIETLGPNYQIVTSKSQPMSDYLLELALEKQREVDYNYIAALSVTGNTATVWFNNQFLHSAPLALSLLHSAVARSSTNDGNGEISISNWPLSELTISYKKDLSKLNIPISFVMSMTTVTSFFILFLIKERRSRFKLLQFITGTRVCSFWMVHLIFDMIAFLLVVFVTIFAIYCVQPYDFQNFLRYGYLALIYITFGFAVFPFIYFVSFIFRKPISAFLSLFIGGAIAVFFAVIIYKRRSMSPFWARMDLLGLFDPHITLFLALCDFIENMKVHDVCHGESVCEILPQCCSISGFLEWEEPGILRQLLLFAGSGILFFTMVCLIDAGFFTLIAYWLRKNPKRGDQNQLIVTYQDEDVHREKDLVKKMSRKEVLAHTLVLDRVTKTKECFGLLGVNGSGKTTTLKMMTGEERLTSGEIYTLGLRMKTQRTEIYKKLGYCPQYHAVMDLMTGRETLYMFCLLHGIPQHSIAGVIELLADSFGLSHLLDKKTRNYSSGNKRKLITALTFIGSPSIIYLDEPTCGIDPVAKRDLWNMIATIRNFGTTVVLTSHSMEECEALCTRIVIMVNGEFKCLGSIQHLKNRFARGIVLKIKLRKLVGSESVHANAKLKEFILHNFPTSSLREEYENLMTFYVPLSRIYWALIFRIMETNRHSLNIEDYYVSQVSLAEVFREISMLPGKSRTY